MTTVFVNGTFDILHRGHIELLNYARTLGDKLVVAIDSDDRVRSLKGSDRPIITENDRKFHLQNLKSVDEVEIFSDDNELNNLILKHKASIMVKGSDYRNKSVPRLSILRIEFYERTEHSTTKTIQSIIDR
jgi:D-beta-D-heptose 7-phosphate kinase/D-beta-D-heptose 1-phosphate adenosyltransferase